MIRVGRLAGIREGFREGGNLADSVGLSSCKSTGDPACCPLILDNCWAPRRRKDQLQAYHCQLNLDNWQGPDHHADHSTGRLRGQPASLRVQGQDYLVRRRGRTRAPKAETKVQRGTAHSGGVSHRVQGGVRQLTNIQTGLLSGVSYMLLKKT